MECRLFHNGNFHIRKTEENEHDLEFQVPVHNLGYLLYNQTFEDFILEDQWNTDYICYRPVVLLYNAKTQLFYKITDTDAEDYFQGKTVILQGFEESQEFLEENFYVYRDNDEYTYEEAV